MPRKIDTDTEEQVGLVCSECGMEREEWGDPKGYVDGDKTYCCEGCPQGDCTCE